MTLKSNQLEIPFYQVDRDKLDNIQTGAEVNPPYASNLEALAGLDNWKIMTALRVKEAIVAAIGSGVGEANTASNEGSGSQLFLGKTGVNLKFRTVVAGSGVTIQQQTDTLIISASPGGLTDTDGLPEGSLHKYYSDSRVASAPSVILNTAKVSADGSINTHSDVQYSAPSLNQVLGWSGTEWVNQTLPAVGEINTASNLGTGVSLFKSKVGVDLQFKTLEAGTNVSISQVGDNLRIDSTITEAPASYVRVLLLNNTGGILQKGTPVSVDSFGNIQRLIVSNEVNVTRYLGIVVADINHGSQGYVATGGKIESMQAIVSMNFGDLIYVSKTGDLTSISPDIGVGGFVAGDFVLRVGVVTKNQLNPSVKDLTMKDEIVGQLA